MGLVSALVPEQMRFEALLAQYLLPVKLIGPFWARTYRDIDGDFS
jgi:hypothetical protein